MATAVAEDRRRAQDFSLKWLLEILVSAGSLTRGFPRIRTAGRSAWMRRAGAGVASGGGGALLRLRYAVPCSTMEAGWLSTTDSK